MSYHRPPEDRPRRAKQFLTEREIEDLAASGKTEIRQTDDLVITDAARETAADLGISIVAEDSPRAESIKQNHSTQQSARVVVSEIRTSAPLSRSNNAAQALHNAPIRQVSSSLNLPQQRPEFDPMVKSIVMAVRMLWHPPQSRTRQLARMR